VRRTASALLILSCSKRKKHTTEPLPAIELYDGPAFRVVRKFFREANGAPKVDVVILSAKYGFISGDDRIGHYDLRMSKKLASENANLWRGQLIRLLNGRLYRNVFVNLGRDYMLALPDLAEYVTKMGEITTANGRIGERLHGLKQWLRALAFGQK